MLPPAPPPQPRFDGFSNAFSASPNVSRVKRQRTGSVMPQNGSPGRASSPARSPANSPAKRRASEHEEDGPRTPTPGPTDDIDMEMGGQKLGVDALSLGNVDSKTEVRPTSSIIAGSNKKLLYHLFNYVPVSRFQSTYNESSHTQPVLYRILNYRPALHLDREGVYGSWLSDLLEACGNPASTFDQLLDVFTCAMANCAKIAASGLREPSYPEFHLAEVCLLPEQFMLIR